MESFGIVAGILTFLAVFFFVFAINLVLTDLFNRDKSESNQSDLAAYREFERQRVRKSIAKSADKGIGQISQASLDESTSYSPWKHLDVTCARSGLRITPANVVVYGAIAALITAVVFHLIFHHWAVTLGVALFASLLPYLRVSMAASARSNMLRGQLPDALELMCRVMRSGQTINQGMSAIAEEFMPPVSTEFGYCYEQQNLGLNAETALRDLASRSGLMEIRIFVVAVLVHRQAGGNMTELLGKLSGVIRSRIRMAGDVKALTAEGRMQAWVLMGLPIVIWLAIFALNRPYAMKLFEHPDLIVVSLVLMSLGAVWIHRIVNFDF